MFIVVTTHRATSWKYYLKGQVWSTDESRATQYPDQASARVAIEKSWSLTPKVKFAKKFTEPSVVMKELKAA
jgi:hypothetical protein